MDVGGEGVGFTKDGLPGGEMEEWVDAARSIVGGTQGGQPGRSVIGFGQIIQLRAFF